MQDVHRRALCLNPYYTGIHLHYGINKKLDKVCLCLNPYYTGIHLHISSELNQQFRSLVLILIILEYIYILSVAMFSSCSGVLILIILEYIYIFIPDNDGSHHQHVLILIILEYIYISEKNGFFRNAGSCLNPYYTGIHLHNINH